MPEQTVVTVRSLLHRIGAQEPSYQSQIFLIFYLELHDWELKPNMPKHAWAKTSLFTQNMQLSWSETVIFSTAPGYPRKEWKVGMYAPSLQH